MAPPGVGDRVNRLNTGERPSTIPGSAPVPRSTGPERPARPVTADRNGPPGPVPATANPVGTGERPQARPATGERPARPAGAGPLAAPAAGAGPRSLAPPQGPGRVETAPARPAPVAGPVNAAPEGRWQRMGVNHSMSTRWKAGLTALGVILVLAVCGLSTYLIVLDEQQGVQAQANGPTPGPSLKALASREEDPEPLTVAEVFPGKTIVIDPLRPTEAYKVLRTQELKSCKSATSGEISKLIEQLGCSQAIRATMLSPTGGYVVTGGVLNLESVEEAGQAWDQIKFMVDQNKGRFVGYAERNDRTTKPLILAPTHAGWNIRGHYMVYCVIARTDEQEIAAGDPFAKQILYDVIEFYLKGVVIEGRAGASGASPATAASGTVPATG